VISVKSCIDLKISTDSRCKECCLNFWARIFLTTNIECKILHKIFFFEIKMGEALIGKADCLHPICGSDFEFMERWGIESISDTKRSFSSCIQSLVMVMMRQSWSGGRWTNRLWFRPCDPITWLSVQLPTNPAVNLEWRRSIDYFLSDLRKLPFSEQRPRNRFRLILKVSHSGCWTFERLLPARLCHIDWSLRRAFSRGITLLLRKVKSDPEEFLACDSGDCWDSRSNPFPGLRIPFTDFFSFGLIVERSQLNPLVAIRYRDVDSLSISTEMEFSSPNVRLHSGAQNPEMWLYEQCDELVGRERMTNQMARWRGGRQNFRGQSICIQTLTQSWDDVSLVTLGFSLRGERSRRDHFHSSHQISCMKFDQVVRAETRFHRCYFHGLLIQGHANAVPKKRKTKAQSAGELEQGCERAMWFTAEKVGKWRSGCRQETKPRKSWK